MQEPNRLRFHSHNNERRGQSVLYIAVGLHRPGARFIKAFCEHYVMQIVDKFVV